MELFEPVEAAFDDVALLLDLRVEDRWSPAADALSGVAGVRSSRSGLTKMICRSHIARRGRGMRIRLVHDHCHQPTARKSGSMRATLRPSSQAPIEPACITESTHFEVMCPKYACGPWGNLLQHKTPGRSHGDTAPEATRPHRSGPTASRPPETPTGTPARRRPDPGTHRGLPGRSDGVRTSHPIRHRTADSQQHPPPAPSADAATWTLPRTGRRRHPPLQPRLVTGPSRRTPGRQPTNGWCGTGRCRPVPRKPSPLLVP